MEDILIIKKLHYKNIFNELNLIIKKNTINFLVGPNNSGKTTLFKILTDEIKRYSGYINDQNNIACIYSDRIGFVFDNVYDEAMFVADNNAIEIKNREKKVIAILTKYNLQKDSKIDDLSILEKIMLLLALEEIKKTKILLLDNILALFTEEEIKSLMKVFKTLKKDITIIISASNLDNVLYGDYLHVMNDKEIILSDETLAVLKHDSTLNKIGFKLPFIVDLSIKLKYYKLIDSVETNMNRLVNKLWD